MSDHFPLNLRFTSLLKFLVVLLLFFELQSNLFCFLTPASFHRHVSICGDTKNCAFLMTEFQWDSTFHNLATSIKINQHLTPPFIESVNVGKF